MGGEFLPVPQTKTTHHSLRRSRAEDHAEMLANHYLSALELARTANQDTSDLVPPARAALYAAGDRAFALNAFERAAGFYRTALALWPLDAQKQRAGLLRLLGIVLFEAGDLEHAATVLEEGSQVAGAVYLQGRLDEAQQLTEEAHASAAPDDVDAQARWRATQGQAARPPRSVSRRPPAGRRGGGARLADFLGGTPSRDTDGQSRS